MQVKIDLNEKIRNLEDDIESLKYKLQNYRAISAALFVCVVLLTMVKAG